MLCAAALFAACSSTDELEPVVQAGEQTAEEAVGFDVYTRGSQQTRAGYVGEIDATAFQVTGFGVYAYVTSGTDYAAGKWDAKKTTAKPDFMANQHVTYSGGWTYSPVKYWPNQANTNGNGVDNLGGGSATNDGTNIDYVSFFAYAPYVDDTTLPYKEDAGYTAATAEAAINSTANTGIIWLPANNTTGDPKVVYRMAADPTNAVDLMYGVAARAYTVNETTGQQGKPVTAGMPFLDMTKEVVADKLNYRFQHALTKLAVNVDAYFDEVRNGSTPGTNDVDPNTRIVIESVVITTDKLAVHGTMNLNNSAANTPNWTIDNKAKITTGSSSYNDGNGYELPIANGLKHVTLTDKDKYFAQQPLGVTKNKQSLLGYAVDGTTPASLMFVPNTAGTSGLDIVITYRVITRDARLKDTYSEATNVIKQTIAAGDLNFGPGYSTVLNLHLGMTSVKMDAVISAWDGTDTKEIDLPANVKVKEITGLPTINNYGAITLTASKYGVASFTTIQADGASTVDLSANDVIFTDESNNVLTVTDRNGTPYLPGNYNGASRTIKMWYAGVYKEITQESIPASDLTLTVTSPAGNINGDGETVTLSFTYDDKIKDFNYADWTVSATPAPQSVSAAGATINVVVGKNPSNSEARNITFTVTHNKGLTKSTEAKTQAASTAP